MITTSKFKSVSLKAITVVLMLAVIIMCMTGCGYKSGDYKETMYQMTSLQNSDADTGSQSESTYSISIDGSTITFNSGSTTIGSGTIKGDTITWDEESYGYSNPYSNIMSGLLSVSVNETNITKVKGSDDVMISFEWIAIGYGDWVTSYYFEKE